MLSPVFAAKMPGGRGPQPTAAVFRLRLVILFYAVSTRL
jgi:hypothetical protein